MIRASLGIAANRQEAKSGSKGKFSSIVRETTDPITGETIALNSIVTNGGIADMHAKGRLTDLQKAAADRFLGVYETAHSDGMKAINYARERVDVSFEARSFGANARALRELERLSDIVGDAAYAVLLSVIVRGWSVRQIAKAKHDRFGGSFSYKQEKTSRALFEALDKLDAHWNTAVGVGAGMRAETVRGEVLVETSPTRVEASTVDGAVFVSGVSKLKDAALLRKEGLAKIAAPTQRSEQPLAAQ